MAAEICKLGECSWFIKGVDETEPDEPKGAKLWENANYGTLGIYPRSTKGAIDWSGYGTPSAPNPWKNWARKIQRVRVEEGVKTGCSLRRFLSGCLQATELDIELLDAAAVQDVGCLFENCQAVSMIDVRFLEGSEIELADGMFRGCSFLQRVDLSSIDDTEIADVSELFADCISLTEVQVPWQMKRVRTVSGMFAKCRNLRTADLSSAVLNRCENYAGWFRDCVKLERLDLRNVDLSRARDLFAAFYGCTSLSSVQAGSKWEIPDTARAEYMCKDAPVTFEAV